MKTPQNPGSFVKVAECLYRYDKSGSYFALFKVAGRQRRINLETKDLAHAKRLRDEERRKLERVDHAKSQNTLEACIPDYLKRKELLSKNSRDRTTRVLERLRDFVDGDGLPLGKWKVAKIAKGNLERFMNEMTKSEELSVRTRKDYLALLKGFFTDLVDDDVIAVSPAEKYKITERTPKVIRKTPSLEEVKAIIEEIRTSPFSDTREESADFLQFMAGAGVGNAEAYALKVGDINWKAGTMRLRRVKTKTDYDVPIFPAVEEMLKRRVKDKDAKERVFSVKDIKKSLTRACNVLKLPHYSHRAFRRFFITAALDANASARAVASWQGHSDIKLVLQVYSEVRGEYSKQESTKVLFTF